MAPGPRVLMLAPFARGLPHGGSQRATAIAERLERRGASISWVEAERVALSNATRASTLLRRRPVLVASYGLPGDFQTAGHDLVMAAHSYLAPLAPPDMSTVADFHNLEWQHLRDVARDARGARRAWLRRQATLMRRSEIHTVRRSALSLFTTATELQWARQAHPAAANDQLLVVPNRLPSAEVANAEAIAAARQGRASGEDLAYLGSLRFPPNARALARFISDVWPVLRRARPRLELHVAGGIGAPPPGPELTAAGVHHLGFVEDLQPLLERVAAVVFPFAGLAGSSLRALYLGLAGVPVIGAPEAFRGHGAPLGLAAQTAEEWQQAMTEATAAPTDARSQAGARALQAEESEWDALYAALSRLSCPGEPDGSGGAG